LTSPRGVWLRAATLAFWPLALALWLLNRALDGLDGAVARASGGGSDLGGLLDFLADFVVYGGFVVGVAIAEPDARVARTVLLAYVAFCLVPSRAEVVAWVFAAMVLFTVGQRVRLAFRTLA
jgi:phosphatidylglycerophosphate synthase